MPAFVRLEIRVLTPGNRFCCCVGNTAAIDNGVQAVVRLADMYDCAYTMPMMIEWDEAKRRRNLRKHGVDFADAVAVLDDPQALTREDTDSQGEQVQVTLGMDAVLRLLVVVWTQRLGNTIRIISARRANAKERRQYED